LDQSGNHVFYSEEGVRIRNLMRVQTVPWPQVANICTAPVDDGGTAGTVALWLTTTDGQRIKTSLRRAAPGRWLRRGSVQLDPAVFDRAVETLTQAWKAPTRPDAQAAPSKPQNFDDDGNRLPDQFRALLDQVDRRVHTGTTFDRVLNPPLSREKAINSDQIFTEGTGQVGELCCVHHYELQHVRTPAPPVERCVHHQRIQVACILRV
jgi:hypothetical protein